MMILKLYNFLSLTIFFNLCSSAYISVKEVSDARHQVTKTISFLAAEDFQNFGNLLLRDKKDKLAYTLETVIEKLLWSYTGYRGIMRDLIYDFEYFDQHSHASGSHQIYLSENYIKTNLDKLKQIISPLDVEISLLEDLSVIVYKVATYIHQEKKGIAGIPIHIANSYNDILHRLGNQSVKIGNLSLQLTKDIENIKDVKPMTKLKKKVLNNLKALGDTVEMTAYVIKQCKLYFDSVALKDRENNSKSKHYDLNVNKMYKSVNEALNHFNSKVGNLNAFANLAKTNLI